MDELFKLMQIMVIKHPDASEADQRDIFTFKRTTLMTYLQVRFAQMSLLSKFHSPIYLSTKT